MRSLPSGWTLSTIPVLCEVLDSLRVPINADERNQRLAKCRQEDLVPYFGATGQVGWIDAFLFDEDLVLLGEDGVPFLDEGKPKAYRVSGKSWVNNHAHVLRAREEVIDWRLLTAQLNTVNYRGYVTGSTRLKLTQGAMNKLPLLVPPRAEQKRIADKLDTVLTRVDAVNTRLARVAPILKRFRQSVLAAATSGRLTEDWRSVNSVKLGEFNRLGTMGAVIAGQSPSVSEVNRNGRGMPYVTGPEQWDGKKILAHKWTEYPKRIAPENSIFITVKGAGVGKTFPGCHAAIGRDIYAFVPSAEHMKKYVLFSIQASAEMVVLKAKGLIPGLTKGDIAEHVVYVPSRREQLEIVRRVETLFAFADRLEARLQAAQTATERLTPALLAKAFRGELVPQDPNDEPASELLKRLLSSAAPANKRNRGRPASVL